MCLPHRTIKIWDLKAALDPCTSAAELCLRTLAVSCTLSTCVCVYRLAVNLHFPILHFFPIHSPVCGTVVCFV